MERVVSRKLMYAYDLLSGLSLALIGGAMFTVSNTAIGVFFDVETPGLNDWLPNYWAFSGVVVFCCMVTTVVATFGITFVSIFGAMATPVLIAGITYLAVQTLQMLGLGEKGDLWYILSEKVYTGVVVDENFSQFGFAYCVFFAWFCDLQLHIGQNDQALLRFVRHERMGWASSAGMFIGHYYAWIVAGCMYAVQLQEDPDNTSVAPGPIANLVGGVFGVIIIIIAGWSTASPVVYAAGQALQHDFPSMKTTTSTLIVGSVATVAALFPGFTSRVLKLLAFAGLILCPMGVILFADFWILPKLGIQSEMAEKGGIERTVNWPAVYTWILALVITVPIALTTELEVFFTPLITVILSLVLHVGLSVKYHGMKTGEVSSFSDKDEESREVVAGRATIATTDSIEAEEL